MLEIYADLGKITAQIQNLDQTVEQDKKVREVLETIYQASPSPENPFAVTLDDAFSGSVNSQRTHEISILDPFTLQELQRLVPNKDRTYVAAITYFDPKTNRIIFRTARHCIEPKSVSRLTDNKREVTQSLVPKYISLSGADQKIPIAKLINNQELHVFYLNLNKLTNTHLQAAINPLFTTVKERIDVAFVASTPALPTLYLQLKEQARKDFFDSFKSVESLIQTSYDNGFLPTATILTTRGPSEFDTLNLRHRQPAKPINATIIGTWGNNITLLLPRRTAAGDFSTMNSLVPGASGSPNINYIRFGDRPDQIKIVNGTYSMFNTSKESIARYLASHPKQLKIIFKMGILYTPSHNFQEDDGSFIDNLSDEKRYEFGLQVAQNYALYSFSHITSATDELLAQQVLEKIIELGMYPQLQMALNQQMLEQANIQELQAKARDFSSSF